MRHFATAIIPQNRLKSNKIPQESGILIVGVSDSSLDFGKLRGIVE